MISAAAVAPLRPKVDDVIGALDHFQVVLDDDDGVALIDQFIERPKQPLDVVEM